MQNYGLGGEEPDKSLNAHNCRKSSLLSKLFMLHKFIAVFKLEGESLQNQIKDLFLTHAKDYLELNSVVFDLQMYSLYLTEAQKVEILENISQWVEDKVNLSAVRKMRAKITQNKLRYMFRAQVPQLGAFQETIKKLTDEYFEFVKLDDKPEKGERKLADEQVLLIADIIDNYIDNEEEEKEGEQDIDGKRKLDFFKVCLLEMAYETSCYNFDIQLALLKSFDRLGWSASFSESFENLGIKGVQLESLGYLAVRHAINWLQFPQLAQLLRKQYKFLKHNAVDLADMKIKALSDNNYSQLDNFIEYEEYFSNSYYGNFYH